MNIVLNFNYAKLKHRLGMKLFLIWCFHAITMCFVVDNRVLLVHIMFSGGKKGLKYGF